MPDPKRGHLREPLLLIGGGGNSAGDQGATSAASTFREVGADIMIGTPGRMEEFLLGKSSMPQKKGATAKAAKGSVRNIVNLKTLDVLVLDEADRCAQDIPLVHT